jgi:hypothetical protein
MNALRELQLTFQRFVYSEDSQIAPAIAASGKASTQTRLAIYSEGYRLRLLEALGAAFPMLKTLAGDAEFERYGRAYIERHDSTYTNLRWYGDTLADFLRCDAPTQPYLAEMADFEWALALAFDAADQPVLALADCAGVAADDWPGLRFELHTSVQRLNYRSNVTALWTAIQREETPPAYVQALETTAWLIWRRELTPYFRSLSAAESGALDAVSAGETFADLCECLCAWHPPGEVAQAAAVLLARWVGDGMIVRLR